MRSVCPAQGTKSALNLVLQSVHVVKFVEDSVPRFFSRKHSVAFLTSFYNK
uniref:Uncharacterized protein n=2 Tax=Picea TaxID=3328 RepID=A0A101LXQ3_PICGL|nr:hypothetical protein ABT39_MTgene5462 [Picea glauca]QHR91524.1 hypothetical protein Q903MT_gene5559 [Picea sitchensis]